MNSIVKMGLPIVIFSVVVAGVAHLVSEYSVLSLSLGLGGMSAALAATLSTIGRLSSRLEFLEQRLEQYISSVEESAAFVAAVDSEGSSTAVAGEKASPPSVVTKAFEAPIRPSETAVAMDKFERTLDHTSVPPMSVQQSAAGQHDFLETTQSFLPEQLNKPSGFGAAPAGFSKKPSDPGVMPPPLPTSLTSTETRKSAGRRRYATFAGLSLTGDEDLRTVGTAAQQPSSAQEIVKSMGTMAPPPPPTKQRDKEKRRYSTFAGLSLADRGQNPGVVAAPPTPPPLVQTPQQPVAPSSSSGNFEEYFRPAPGETVSGSSSSNFEEYFRPAPGEIGAATQTSATKPSSAGQARTEQKRKRYQTFMGLSLSKTPPAVMKLPSSDSTAPLPSSYAPHSPQPGTQVNKGQVASLVDGFCSLCGSPQAAGRNLEDTLSTPEFCWYCGARLRLRS
ncbi:MAG: hypothetical protein RMM17_04320 [Acidobacteriota bacterium]|nr:hypothetical protein [Blastocatellia bacterium]MDW8411887.1 hypothetical protein [Acidobacteriota bacterium]